MSFTVSMVIDGDASRALQAMEAANRGAQGLGRGIAGLAQAQTGARGATASFTQSTAQMERGLRSSASTAAMLPPRIDAVAAATGRAVREQARLTPAANAATGATNRFAMSMRNAASNVALMHGPLGGVASRFSALATIFTRMPAPIAAVTVAVTALTFASTAGIRVFAEYERQLLTVEQVIRATGGAAGRTTEDIDRMALSIARGTLASAREVRAAASQVLTFRSIAGDTFDRTLELAQDLAAVGFGSIEQAAVQLAKALEDPEQGLSALRRVGISFSAAQMELIRNFNETGRVAEAQNAILAQVEAQVGGAGSAAAGGLSGAFDSLTGATSRWFELVGQRLADAIGLQGALQGIADGIEAVNESLDPGDATRLRNMQETARVLIELRAELARVESDPRTLADPMNTAAQRSDLEARIAETRSMFEQMLAAEQAMEAERARISEQAAEEDKKRAQERVSAIIAELERELEAVGRTAVETEILTATRRAGVTEADAEYQSIANLVSQRLEETAAIAASAAEQERASREAETGRQRVDDLIASLNAEMAVMQASDPVMRTMIGHRNALTFATDAQAAAVRELVAAIEAEQRAQAFSSEIERLQFETSIQGLSDVERRIATAQRRLQVDPDSDQGRQLEAEIRQNHAAEEARRGRERAQRAGARATKAETDAVSKLIHSLQAELDIMREVDPVAQEMIRHREALTDATDAEREQVRLLIEELQRETVEREAMQERMRMFRDLTLRTFDDLIFQGKSFQDVMAGVARMIARAAFEAALFGTRPMAALFGGGGGGGGLFSAIIGALTRRADGGPIPGYAGGGDVQVGGRAAGLLGGTGGPREDNILFWGSAGEFMVNARSAAKYSTVLKAINEDRLPALASGGPLRPIHAPAQTRHGGFAGDRAWDDPHQTTHRIELVLNVAEGVTVEQVGEIAAGVALTIQQGTAQAQKKALPGQLMTSQIRRG